MKKILSFFLIILICTVFIAACGDNSKTSNTATTAQNGTTSIIGTTSAAGTNASTSATLPVGSGATTATSTTNTSATNITASTNATTTASSWICSTTPHTTTATVKPSDPEIEKGERITEEQWNYLISDSIKNFSFIQIITSGNAAQTTYMIVNGEEYIQTITMNGEVKRKVSQFIIDGVKGTYNCDLETGKWTHIGLHVQETYPLYACPYPFAEFNFDESTGTYSYTNVEDAEMDAKRKVEMRFKDGVCIYLKMTMTTGENVAGIIEATIFDHGTTYVPHPDPSDITVSSGSEVTNPGADNNGKH